MFEDQLVPEINPPRVGVPANWVDQCQCVDTYDLPPTSEEWKICEKMVQKSLQVTITKVTRVQNMWLWEAYNFNKARMLRRNGGITNEMYLFHVSGSSNPFEIACEEDGYPMIL